MACHIGMGMGSAGLTLVQTTHSYQPPTKRAPQKFSALSEPSEMTDFAENACTLKMNITLNCLDGGRAEGAHLDPCESFRLGAFIDFIGVFGHGYESQSVVSDRFGCLVFYHHTLYFLVCKFGGQTVQVKC